MKKTRIGLVGCGGMAKAHVGRFQSILDRLEITAVADIEIQRAQAVADLLTGNPMVASDYHDIVGQVDAVLLALPHHLHHPAGMYFIDKGKHVLMEKPLANSERECLELIEAAKKMDVVLMVAYCMRFHPLVLKFKEILDSKTYGEVFQLSIWTEQHTEREPSNWICRADQLGGGQLFSHGCHYIDLMLWMMGKPLYGSHVGTNLGTPWMEREGTSNVSIAFEGGRLGYHFGTWGARGTRLGYSFHAHCEKGMLEADISGGKLYFHGDASAHDPDNFNPAQRQVLLMEMQNCKPTEEEMRHFIDCIETGAVPLTDAVSSLEGLKVIWKLYEAEDKRQLANLEGLGLGTMRRGQKQQIANLKL
jgi:predicted dehydrogenase